MATVLVVAVAVVDDAGDGDGDGDGGGGGLLGPLLPGVFWFLDALGVFVFFFAGFSAAAAVAVDVFFCTRGDSVGVSRGEVPLVTLLELDPDPLPLCSWLVVETGGGGGAEEEEEEEEEAMVVAAAVVVSSETRGGSSAKAEEEEEEEED